MSSFVGTIPLSPLPMNHKSVASLFGDENDSAPLWFKKDAFALSSFEPEAYISDLRRFVPFETLRTELRGHLGGLKNELVELINRDYTDFVNLSTKLVDVDGSVLRMRMPLNELRAKLVLVRDTVNSTLLLLGNGLKRRVNASASREILELLLDTSHVVSKVLLSSNSFSSYDDGRMEAMILGAASVISLFFSCGYIYVSF